MNDNRTVLLPASDTQETLTGFSSGNTFNSAKPKSSTAVLQQHYKAFFQEKDINFIDGLNPFNSSAKPLFIQMEKLLNTYDMGDVGNIHLTLIEETETFSQNCAKQNVESSQISVARYLLCTFLDELICTTPWGKSNDWARDSLLSHFYRETYGGEKFFQLLTKLLASPANNIHLLEFMYVCIALGFEGKYRIQTRGKMELDVIRENLYKQIKTVHGRQSQTFYAEPKISSQQHHYVYKAPYLLLALSVFGILTIIYGLFSFKIIGKENTIISSVEKELAATKSITLNRSEPIIEKGNDVEN